MKMDETLAAPSCLLVWLSARTGLSNAMLPMCVAGLGGLLAPRPFSSLLLTLARLHTSSASCSKAWIDATPDDADSCLSLVTSATIFLTPPTKLYISTHGCAHKSHIGCDAKLIIESIRPTWLESLLLQPCPMCGYQLLSWWKQVIE